MRVIVAVLGALGASAATAAEPPPIALAPGFRVELVAEGLGAPRMLALDSSGALLVSIPSQGRIVALPAAPRPQRLRSPVTVVEGLRLPHGLAVRDGHLWVAETGRVLRFRYDVTTRRATEPVAIIPDLPAGAHHWTRFIAFGPDGRLYVAIGSSCDICREADRRRAAIVSYAADGSNERLVARGLRNPVGLAFDPRTGALWTTVSNEPDWRRGRRRRTFSPWCARAPTTAGPTATLKAARSRPIPSFAARATVATSRCPRSSWLLARRTARVAFYTGTQFPPRTGEPFVARMRRRPGRACPRRATKMCGDPLSREAAHQSAGRGLRDALAAGAPGQGRPVDVLVGRDGALTFQTIMAGGCSASPPCRDPGPPIAPCSFWIPSPS